MDKDFQDKVVIITGSNSGLGKATALEFVRLGAKVTLCGRNEERLQKTLEECQKAGGRNEENNFLYVSGDLCEAAVRERTIEETVKKFGRLDILVCNHVAAPREWGTLATKEESFDVVVSTILKATFFLIQKAVPHLEASKGCVIVVSSVMTSIVGPELILYAMCKSALEFMIRSMALEFGAKGIRVNCIKPTQISNELGNFGAKLLRCLKSMGPAHPLYGRPSTEQEQVDVLVFLASQASRFITGQSLIVDAGITIRGFPDV